MGDSSKIMCRECGTREASYRCAECGYVICKKCAEKLGGGAWSHPRCPMCDSKDWKGV